MAANINRKLLRLAAATPFVQKLLNVIIKSAKTLSDKSKLRDELIRNLRGENVPFTVPADHTTELEIVRFLYDEKKREELLATLDETLAKPLRQIGEELDAFFSGFYEPTLEDPRRFLASRGRTAESLLARVARDEFRERSSDIDFLDRFLGDSTATGALSKFRWALVTGPGGDGKTRLAIEFLGLAQARAYRAGFLPDTELKNFEPRRWRPRWASLLVIDYPAQAPKEVAEILRDFSARASQSADEFGYPVRLLLLEREAEGEWFKTIVPPGSQVANFCFTDGPKSDHRLSPLSRPSLIAIMRGRLQNRASIDDDELYNALVRVDARSEDVTPRPLFAAATGQAIADAIDSGKPPSDIIHALQCKDVLTTLIERQRRFFWAEGKPPFGADELRRQKLHENLLLIATMALNLPRRHFDDDCPDVARRYLPDFEMLEEERYRRMAGGDPKDIFNRLEPDIIGEFFVLDTLRNHRGLSERQALIDAGLRLGGLDAAVFVIRCAKDFPDNWNELDRLKPSGDLVAMQVFGEAAAYLSIDLSDERISDIDAIVSDIVDLSNRFADRTLTKLAAQALVNMGCKLGDVGRNNEQFVVYDHVVTRFGDSTDPALKECVSYALLNKGHALNALGDFRRAIGVWNYVLDEFGDSDDSSDPVLSKAVASALIGKGDSLKMLTRTDEAIVVYDMAADTAELDLPDVLANALVKKGIVFNELGCFEEAIRIFDDVVHRFGDSTEPDLCEQVALAFVNKGNILGALDRYEEAIDVYDDVIDRFGSSNAVDMLNLVFMAFTEKQRMLTELGDLEKALAVFDDWESCLDARAGSAKRLLIATVLVNKGETLFHYGSFEEALLIYNDLATRFGDSAWQSLREVVARALLNKGITLNELCRFDDAAAAYDDVVARFGDASEPAMREAVAKALKLKKKMLRERHLGNMSRKGPIR